MAAPLESTTTSTQAVPLEEEEVFISYSREDAAIVQPFAKLLRAAGVRVFIDVENIQLGDRWEEVLMNALERCTRAFIFWSAHSSDSDWVKREITVLVASGRARVIPVILDKTPLPPEIAPYQGIEWLLMFTESVLGLDVYGLVIGPEVMVLGFAVVIRPKVMVLGFARSFVELSGFERPGWGTIPGFKIDFLRGCKHLSPVTTVTKIFLEIDRLTAKAQT